MTRTPLVKSLLCAAALTLSACAAPEGAVTRDGILDPYEAGNRQMHQFNKSVDKMVVRPLGQGFSAVAPDVVEDGITNFATNAGMPSVMVNGVLQGDLELAGVAFSRFFINTVFGFVGLIDVATAFEIPEADTDFGETLHVWGAKEGPYLELPLVGPSTQRDAIGSVVDLFTNPLGYALDDPEENYGTAASIVAGLSNRGRFSETVDSVLYDSADSYAQLRLIYLQNRRFELGQEDQSQSVDPFELDTEGF